MLGRSGIKRIGTVRAKLASRRTQMLPNRSEMTASNAGVKGAGEAGAAGADIWLAWSGSGRNVHCQRGLEAKRINIVGDESFPTIAMLDDRVE